MISAIAWVPKGKASSVPKIQEPTAEELEAMKEMAKEEEDDEEEDEEVTTSSNKNQNNIKTLSKEDAEIIDKYGLDEYDDEVDMEDGNGGVGDILANTTGMFHNSNEEDPYITLKEDEIVDSEGEEDYNLRSTDAVLLTCHTEEDYSALEVHVYEENTGNFYVHHEVPLAAFPLCVSWLDCGGNSAVHGNFAAVGTFKTEIEIWDLDVIDAVEPTLILGGEIASSVVPSEGKGKKNKFKKIKKTLAPGSHTDSVMDIAWNFEYRHLLASASADKTVKVWDLNTQACIHTFTHHTDKVQSVVFNPSEASIMATGSFDHTVVVMDAKNPSHGAKFSVSSDIEDVVWNPFQPMEFVAATDDGYVIAFDVRKGGESPLWKLQAHDSDAVSSVSFSSIVSGLMATSSTDKSVKIWDVQGGKPVGIASKSLGIEEIFSISFYPSSPWLLAAGGGNGNIAVWEINENEAVERNFSSRM